MSECPAQIARQQLPARPFMNTAGGLEEKHLLPSGISPSSSGKSMWAAQKLSVAPAGPCWSRLNVLVLCWTCPPHFLLPPFIDVCMCPNHSCPFLSLNSLSRVTKALPSVLHLLPFPGQTTVGKVSRAIGAVAEVLVNLYVNDHRPKPQLELVRLNPQRNSNLT